VVSGMVIFALIAFGAFILVFIIVLASARGQSHAVERQHQEIQQRRQAAERDIAEIGQATRAAIMDEVQRRLRQGPS